MVRDRGLEPLRCKQQILSLSCLPIPPISHMVSVVRVELTYAEAHQHLKLTCIPFQHTDICKIAPPAILSTLFIDRRYKIGRVVPRICASDWDKEDRKGKQRRKTLRLGVPVTPRHLYMAMAKNISDLCQYPAGCLRNVSIGILIRFRKVTYFRNFHVEKR